MEQIYTLHEKEDVCPIKETVPMAGGSMVSYKGRKYKVRTGARGGRYILVGSEKKKIYI